MTATVAPTRIGHFTSLASSQMQKQLKIYSQQISTTEKEIAHLALEQQRIEDLMSKHFDAIGSDKAPKDLIQRADRDLGELNQVNLRLKRLSDHLESLKSKQIELKSSATNASQAISDLFSPGRAAPSA